MALRVKADLVAGSLKPLEPRYLEEGTAVTLTFERDEPARTRQHNIVETIDRLRKDIGEDKWDGGLTDGERNYRHYLYGHQRMDEE